MEDCSFKRASNSDCHESMYSRKKFITESTKLKPEEQEVLLWRSGLRNHVAEVTTICNHHMQQFGPVFERNQDKCCDVFNAHKKKVKGVRMLSLESAKQLASKGFNVIPGWKCCCNCKTKFSNTICESIDEDENMEDDFQINKFSNADMKQNITAPTGHKSFICQVCDKAFSRKHHLEQHLTIHSGLTPFRCEVCSRAFSRKDKLTEHIKTHTGETPFSCEVCSRAFSRKDNLKEHMKIHTGETPFPCKVCGKAFSRKIALKEHINKHRGEKPFCCEICGKAFSHKSSLKRHFSIHT